MDKCKDCDANAKVEFYESLPVTSGGGDVLLYDEVECVLLMDGYFSLSDLEKVLAALKKYKEAMTRNA